MRKYGQVSPRFWTGKTGRRIRASGDANVVVALYLMTCPSSTMTGLYYLPLVTIAHETGRTIEGASESLRSLHGLDFCSYDFSAEVVFVHTMAFWQVARTLKPTDKRVKGVVTALEPYSTSQFYDAFWQRYSVPFCLDYSLAARPIEGASEVLGRGTLQEQEQKQDQEQEKEQEQGARARGPGVDFSEVKGRTDLARAIADRVWQRQEEMRQELKDDGIGVRSRALGLTDPSKLELVHRISEALAAGAGEVGSELNCLHVLAVLEADCRKALSLRWLDGQHWRADRYTPTLTREPGEPFRAKPASSGGIASANDLLGTGGK